MWIRNKVTNTLQEIHNMDVIRICQKDTDKYEVTQNHPDSEPEALATSHDEAKDIENTMTENEDDNSKAVSEPDTESETENNNADYSSMKLNDLRKLAKEKGIQGYMNMDQATLAAVIAAH